MKTIILRVIQLSVFSFMITSAAYAVSGDGCVPATPDIGYRPSLFECNGNAAVILRNGFRDAYSVVVRRFNAQYNDRDPDNTGCSTNECSPYKTQEIQEYPEYQVRCLGGSGYSDKYTTVTRISVKFTAVVTNSRDTSQFQQYCIPNVESPFN